MTHRRLRIQPHQDAGFSLLEIMVAITVFAIAAAGITPLFLSAIRAAAIAKYNTQAKNLMQERIDSMRNLPYHVATSSGPYVDLLDTYFRDLGTSSNSARCDTWSYASTTSTYTCGIAASLNFAGFSEQIDSQFIDQDLNVVVPPSTYTSQSAGGSDVPPSGTLGVTVTVSWAQYGKTNSFTAFTAISSASTGLPQTVSRIRDSAVSVDTTLDDTAVPSDLRFDAGIVNANTSLSTGATANAVAQGALATSRGLDASSTNQATGSLDAPADQPTFTTLTGPVSGGPLCGTLSCFGPTSVSNVTGTANSGLPTVGTASAPVTSVLTRSGNVSDRGFWVSNVPTGLNQLALTRLMVQDPLNPPSGGSPTQLVRSIQGSPSGGFAVPCSGAAFGNGNADFATATGYLTSAGGIAHSVSSCSTATARRVDVMPTSFAPNGVVQMTLDYARTTCSSTGPATTAIKLYSAEVAYWNMATTSYVTLPVVDTQLIDPLLPGLLTKGVGGVQVGVDGAGQPLWLGDYIKSWSSGAFTNGSTGTTGQVDLRVASLSTVPTRDADTLGNSSLNVTVGNLSCLAQDNR